VTARRRHPGATSPQGAKAISGSLVTIATRLEREASNAFSSLSWTGDCRPQGTSPFNDRHLADGTVKSEHRDLFHSHGVVYLAMALDDRPSGARTFSSGRTEGVEQ
jgi:hypothetical protein